MKKLLLTLIVFVNMNDPININFIGKNVSLIPEAIADLDNEELKDRNIYNIKGDFKFFGRKYDDLALIANKNDILKYYSFYITGEIDQEFYNTINEVYGFPYKMFNVDQELITDHHYDPVDGSAIVTTITLKECFFEDNPIRFIWKIGEYEITIEHVTGSMWEITIGEELHLE